MYHQQHVYPGAGSCPQYPHHSPGGAQESEGGGTWWYVPSQPAQHTLYEAGPSSYQQPAHQQHSEGGEYSGGPSSHPASPTYAHQSTPSSSSAPTPVQLGREKPIVRRAYHPNPPAYRSEWVMWAGNVPSDAVHDELWRFFTADETGGGGGASDHNSGVDGVAGNNTGNSATNPTRSGVLSIFLISRSSCAFLNYETEAHLQIAVARFNGVPLRAADPRCARLVCRVRRKDDDLRAGVGGQRGTGMHTRWVKAKAEAEKAVQGKSASASASSSPLPLEAILSAVSINDDDEPPARRYATDSNSSASHWYASHFPQRYFILKSLTRDDLDLSVQTGVWATQKHNEGILDRAFRTSKDVFIIFSVNKSGEFYGYARMAGPIGQCEDGRATWAHCYSTASALVAIGPTSHSVPPHVASNINSAPAVLGKPQGYISSSSPVLKGMSLDQGVAMMVATSAAWGESFELDEGALVRAMRPGGLELGSVAEEGEKEDGAAAAAAGRAEEGVEEWWGQDFKLQWLCTERLPFLRTRHIRNPWNHDREVKISRDGTELEPSVGQALLEEWRLYLASEGAGSETATIHAS
ncbi:YT521-B-like domain-containing protein [Mycena leptocephala]|nr:YT521-B-like domain-containing protein [Mycena leptocephala]